MSKDAATAWVFETDLPCLEDVKTKLDAVSPRPWTKRDSDSRPDSISHAVTEHAVARIHECGKGVFVASVELRSANADRDRELEAARARLFADVLPVIGARAVEETKPRDE